MSDSFFGLQVAVRTPSSSWRSRLVSRVRHALDARLPLDKADCYAAVADLLEEASGRIDFGYWDYVPGEIARAELADWVDGVEQTTFEEGDGGGDHVLVTCAFLVRGGSPSDELLGELCDLPEEHWFDRTTFVDLIEGAKRVRWSNVVSDAVYLVPRDALWDLTTETLRGEGYEYLRPLIVERVIHAIPKGESVARCAYCHDSVTRAERRLVVCGRCHTVLHGVCWAELGRCPVMGCQGLNR